MPDGALAAIAAAFWLFVAAQLAPARTGAPQIADAMNDPIKNDTLPLLTAAKRTTRASFPAKCFESKERMLGLVRRCAYC